MVTHTGAFTVHDTYKYILIKANQQSLGIIVGNGIIRMTCLKIAKGQ